MVCVKLPAAKDPRGGNLLGWDHPNRPVEIEIDPSVQQSRTRSVTMTFVVICLSKWRLPEWYDRLELLLRHRAASPLALAVG